MASFSALDRDDNLNALTSGTFDLLVIGGGITGAGIALDAATRGMKVALLEKHDFAYGTSSRSTKLIHGGLRYLKQMEFALVREVGSERAVVHNMAPHPVIPEKMLLPLSEGKSMGYWLTSIGLKIYDLLAGVKNDDRRRMLSRAETLRAEPLLKKAGIKGGALYAEYRTDDARLTTEAIKTAVANGALALNHIEVKEFIHTDGTISGVKAEDKRSGKLLEVSATVVVNATGPWVDTLREVDGSKVGKWLHLTKG
ncbi:MAG: glycerol-3-phosphate dehydrogenase/oxidase, partial [Bacteroidota bacterium]